MAERSIAGNRAAGERIVVAFHGQRGCYGFVHATKRLADALHAASTTVHIETPRARTFGERERIASHRR